MKKICVLIALMSVLVILSYGQVEIFIEYTASILYGADSGFRKIYGDMVFYPELKAGFKVYKDFYLWLGYGLVEVKGDFLNNLGEESEALSVQNYYSWGLGYDYILGQKVNLKIDIGLILVTYHGKAYLSESLVDEDEGQKIGYKFGFGLFYLLTKKFYGGIGLGYFHAQNTKDYLRKVSYGGLKYGITIGFRF